MNDQPSEGISNDLSPAQSTELSFSIVGESQRIRIMFADGARVLPDYVVDFLGGAEEILKVAATFELVTFEQFIVGVNCAREKQAINRFQQNFQSQHFSKFR